MGVHKVGQAPRIPPVCIDLKVVRGTSPLGVAWAGTDLVIRDQNRLVGQIEAQHPPIPAPYRDATDLIHRKRTGTVLFEGDNETRRCEPLAQKNWKWEYVQWKPSRMEGKHVPRRVARVPSLRRMPA
jgi:hypothetical protein